MLTFFLCCGSEGYKMWQVRIKDNMKEARRRCQCGCGVREGVGVRVRVRVGYMYSCVH